MVLFLTLAVTLGVDLRIALTPRIGLQLALTGAIPVLQSVYRFDGSDETLRLEPSPVSGFVGLGPVFRIL